MRTFRTPMPAAAVVTIMAISILLVGAGPAPAAPTWVPTATAAIHPGVQTFTEGGQCTANFVFTDASAVYIGQAAHCSGTGGATATNGCRSGSRPLGTPVVVGGASRPGVLAYSSWITMHNTGESDPDICDFNDLALVRIDPADVGKVNPSMPHWGGPVGLAPSSSPVTSLVYSSGNSELRLGLALLQPKLGVSLGDDAGGRSHHVLTLTPGIPGDSGSGFLDAQGRALGQLSTLEILPLPGTNGVGDLRSELDYMHSKTSMTAQLAVGTQPFNGNQLPLGP